MTRRSRRGDRATDDRRQPVRASCCCPARKASRSAKVSYVETWRARVLVLPRFRRFGAVQPGTAPGFPPRPPPWRPSRPRCTAQPPYRMPNAEGNRGGVFVPPCPPAPVVLRVKAKPSGCASRSLDPSARRWRMRLYGGKAQRAASGHALPPCRQTGGDGRLTGPALPCYPGSHAAPLAQRPDPEVQPPGAHPLAAQARGDAAQEAPTAPPQEG